MTPKRASLKVSEQTFRWIKREQNRVFEATGKEPTQEEVLASLIIHAGNASNSDSIPAKTDATLSALGNLPGHAPWHALLSEILSSGYEPAITAVTSNLREFAISVRHHARNPTVAEDDDLSRLLKEARRMLEDLKAGEGRTAEDGSGDRGADPRGRKRRAG